MPDNDTEDFWQEWGRLQSTQKRQERAQNQDLREAGMTKLQPILDKITSTNHKGKPLAEKPNTIPTQLYLMACIEELVDYYAIPDKGITYPPEPFTRLGYREDLAKASSILNALAVYDQAYQNLSGKSLLAQRYSTLHADVQTRDDLPYRELKPVASNTDRKELSPLGQRMSHVIDRDVRPLNYRQFHASMAEFPTWFHLRQAFHWNGYSKTVIRGMAENDPEETRPMPDEYSLRHTKPTMTVN